MKTGEGVIDHIRKVQAIIGPKPGYSVTALRMTVPGNLYAHGESFLEAAATLHQATKGDFGVSIPLFFCLAQASELFLKSFLSASGKDRRLPGWKSHDLPKLLAAAVDLGLSMKDASKLVVDEIGKQNRQYEFRFMDSTKHIVLPPASRSMSAVADLQNSVIKAVRPFIRVRENS